MIKFIPAERTLELRSSGLRAGIDPRLCDFEGDHDAGSFHAGYFIADRLISVATFHRRAREGFSGTGYQLRGMVTHGDFQGKGIGSQLLNFSLVYLRGQKANYIWCNARKAACHFYQGMGFEVISEEFEIAGIGTHRVMYLKIQ